MPRDDRQKLNSVYERFKYGVKINDRNKIAEAANQARQILFREDDNDYLWSREAALFCGYLLRRANIYDPEVFVVGECFEEAAFAAWREEKYDLAGAYAITALLEAPDNVQNLTIILACSVIKGDDISGLRIFSERLPVGMEPQLKAVIGEAFSAKGFQVSSDQDASAAMEILAKLYPNTEMGKEVEYWLPKESSVPECAAPEQKEAAPTKPAAPEHYYGVISRLNWSERTGVITGDNGTVYSFRYQDITDTTLAKAIQECLRSDLGGKTYMVKFFAEKNAARSIEADDALVDRARAIAADATREDRFEAAFELCKKAVDSSDIRRALGDLIKHAITLFTSKQQSSYVKEALALYEKNITFYPSNAFAVMDVAQCYGYLKKYPLMLEHAEKAVSFPGLAVKQKIAVLSNYLRMTKEYYHYVAKQLESTAVFILEYDGTNTDVPGVEKIVYAVENYDCRVFSLEAAAALGNTELRNYQAELALSICDNNPELCCALLMTGTKLLHNPVQTTVEVVSSSYSSEGLPFVALEEQQIQSSAWEAAIVLLFPVLERYRMNFISKNETELARHLPINNSNGDRVTDPRDLEIGALYYIVSSASKSFEPAEIELIRICRKARNLLAHNRFVPYTDIRTLMPLQ